MRIKKAKERWFEIPNDPDKGRIKIKDLSPGQISDITDKAFSQDITYIKDKKGNFEPKIIQKTDMRIHRELTLQESIVEWENFFDIEGNPLECNQENIIKAAKEITGFTELVTELREKLIADIHKEIESARKNS